MTVKLNLTKGQGLRGTLIALCIIAMGLAGCSENDMIGLETPRGPLQRSNPSPIVFYVGNEEGTIEIPLHGDTAEASIPIVLLTDAEEKIHKTYYQWTVYDEECSALLPEKFYKSAGYAAYPNSIDFTYTFYWGTFSTYKEPESTNGLLRISYESNPFNAYRALVVYLGNDDRDFCHIVQEPNPDGAIPPEGTFSIIE